MAALLMTDILSPKSLVGLVTRTPSDRSMNRMDMASSVTVRMAINSALYVLDAMQPWRFEVHCTSVEPTKIKIPEIDRRDFLSWAWFASKNMEVSNSGPRAFGSFGSRSSLASGYSSKKSGSNAVLGSSGLNNDLSILIGEESITNCLLG